MSRLDDVISDVGYIMDVLITYRDIVNHGDCNTCEKYKTCEHAPELGELVRYNCPFYEKAENTK